MRKVKLFIACSIDGYIAREDGNLDWLSIVEKEGEDYGYDDFIADIDTVIVGRKTYEKVLSMVDEFPHSNKNCFIITRTKKGSMGSIHFYNDSPASLIEKLQQEEGRDIFVDGGSEIIQILLEADLIDEITISMIPIMIGNGIPLFRPGIFNALYNLEQVKSFDTGLMQMRYTRK